MTPEPTGGIYKDQGPDTFVRRFGYADQSGIADRLNFSSPHRYGLRNNKTGLTLKFIGYDPDRNRITDPKGRIHACRGQRERSRNVAFCRAD